MSEYVPTAKRRPLTTARVRIAAVSDRDVDCVHPDSFDVWLKGVRADARREGQAEAWDAGWAARHHYDERAGEPPTPNPYRQEADQ